MKLSLFGERYGGVSATRQLMDDLGNALSGDQPMLMLGGGNPSHIAEVQQHFHKAFAALCANPQKLAQIIGNYDAPQGEIQFRQRLAVLLAREYGWQISAENIALTHGSQSAFYLLFNMLAGAHADGSRQRIFLPLAPEYVGYADLGVDADFFISQRPQIEHLPQRMFKYHVNLQTLHLPERTAAICVSRPTNPTGNVITDVELNALQTLAAANDIPLILDCAYGAPFPEIQFVSAQAQWNRHTILCLSLSKLGLPALRTGIVVADTPVIQALTGINAILHLATGSMGAALATELIETGQLLRLSREVIKPYYHAKARQAVAWLHEALQGCEYHIHQPEGAIFLWLWLPGLPITSQQLYQRLKARGVLVLAGENFFPGLAEDWQHRYECLRLTYAQDDAVVQAGIAIIAEEIRRAYHN